MNVNSIGRDCDDSEVWADTCAPPSDRREAMKFIKKFSHNEEGAVTVDWVVLTAAVVVLAAGVGTLLTGENGIYDTLKTTIENTINPPAE